MDFYCAAVVGGGIGICNAGGGVFVGGGLFGGGGVDGAGVE